MNTQKYKKAGISVLILIVLIVFRSCRNNTEEEIMLIDSHLDKIMYASALGFDFFMYTGGERQLVANSWFWDHITPNLPVFDPFYDDFVFVHSPEEAANFPDNVTVAWPSDRETDVEGVTFSDGLIIGMKWAINRRTHDLYRFGVPGGPTRAEVTLEEFGLTYPLTVADLVDNWEKVHALWNTFRPSEHSSIRSIASAGFE